MVLPKQSKRNENRVKVHEELSDGTNESNGAKNVAKKMFVEGALEQQTILQC